MDTSGPSRRPSLVSNAASPDIMNDPKYTPLPKQSSKKGTDEVDTCRICRGEGTKEEPLFHPCKCSGSIKFVHQGCLMEWLSHSQKKHCELCKTSFRFTKLYSPNMPRSIPTTVFLRRASIHVVQALVTWCRGLLVASVWLFWLPWSMRFVWWALFWIGDGGWSQDVDVLRETFGSHTTVYGDTMVPPQPNATMIPTQAPLRNHDNVWLRLQALVMIFHIDVTSLFSRSFSSALSFSVRFNDSTSNLSTTGANSSDNFEQFKDQHTLLSGVEFFRHLTPSPTVNKFLIDVLEGEVITLAVVIAFILIFLIREWVVQQQPVLNLGAADEPDANENEFEIAPEQPAEPLDPLERVLADNDTLQDPGNDSTGTPWVLTSTDFRTEIEDVLRHVSGINGSSLALNEALTEETESGSTSMKEFKLILRDLEDSVHGVVYLDNDPTSLTNLQNALVHMKSVHSILTYSQQSEIHDALQPIADRFKRTSRAVSTSSQRSEGDLGFEDLDTASSSRPPEMSPRRPTMPTRPYSFRASEIQRDLEEAVSDDVNELLSKPSSPLRPESDVQDSGQSSESWQNLEENANFSSLDNEQIDNQGSYSSRQEVISDATDDIFPSTPVSTSSAAVPLSNLDHFEVVAEGDNRVDEHEDNVRRDSISSTSQTPQAPNNEQNVPQIVVPNVENVPLQHGMEPRDQTIVGRIMHWAWGEIEQHEENAQANDGGEVEEQVIQNIDEEAPFVPMADINRNQENEPDGGNAQPQDPEVAAEAARAGLNLNEGDVGDEAEDLEGIMELIGMQGPLTGLLQNSVFCAVLISATVTTTVWFPYLWGKLVLILLGNPLHLLLTFPLRFISAVTNFAIDCCVFAGSSVAYYALLPFLLFAPVSAIIHIAKLTKWIGKVADTSFLRMFRAVITATTALDNGTFLGALSAHTALLRVKGAIWTVILQCWLIFRSIWCGLVGLNLQSLTPRNIWNDFVIMAQQSWILFHKVYHHFSSSMPKLSDGMNMTVGASATDAAEAIAHWPTSDRVIAILFGYAFFASAGALYLHHGISFTSSAQGKRVEKVIADILQQAGGVMKVILIISIEMIVFPLYCGLLLDAAMLPLFQDASFRSRIDFIVGSPWTAMFVHWFTGTCYMFHFALFVSMCRKIMRTGVLYFIRDPDDPTFHPVRDVLERNISSQLKKIGFSALVYGALVILCMGSVVWTVAHFWTNVFPIRWSPVASIVEFPIDLLIYNVLAPVIVQLLNPSKGLHTVYEYWFRVCAKILRLSHFLFDEDRSQERGDVDQETGRPLSGRFVRAPASDAVRIPRGGNIFLEVTINNERVDKQTDPGSGPHGKSNTQFTKVYVPPWFAFRIYLFIMCLWALTAAVGLCVSVIPLVCGRLILLLFLPQSFQMSDIYAYSMGITTLGGILYGVKKRKEATTYLRQQLSITSTNVASAYQNFLSLLIRTGKLIYAYGALTIFFPSLLALILEFYVIMPLHAYMGNDTSQSYNGTFTDVSTWSSKTIPQHTVHVLQDWTLGLLYLRILMRMLLWDANARPGRALRAIIARGWLDPNVHLATRAFIVPGTLFTILALLLPAPVGWLTARILTSRQPLSEASMIDLVGIGGDAGASFLQEKIRVQIMRFAYPAVAAMCFTAYAVSLLIRAASRWRMYIRDEVYLVGERLHNFPPSRSPASSATATATASTSTSTAQERQ